MSFRFAQAQPRRRPSLTPMIDVVFLLLVFFMLAAHFGQDGALDLAIGAGVAQDWQGPPRLLEITADGLRLNGGAIAPEALGRALSRLTETPTDPIVIRAGDAVSLQRLLDVMSGLRADGFTNLVLVAP
jgi:biopolymer transport protein ExbD